MGQRPKAAPGSLEALAMKFRDDAMKLDPTITNFWIGFDETIDGPREDRVMQLYIERKEAPFVRRRAA
jgi:hypothetical protein